MTTKETPTHVPGADWSREKLQAFLDYYGTTPAAAAGAGVSRQAFCEALQRFGIEVPPPALADPTTQPHNAARKNPTVVVALRPEHHAWLNAQGYGKRSALVQKGVDYLMASDRAAWLAEHEEPDVLARAAKRARAKP